MHGILSRPKVGLWHNYMTLSGDTEKLVVVLLESLLALFPLRRRGQLGYQFLFFVAFFVELT